MPTPIKLMATAKQSHKIREGEILSAVIQVRGKAGEKPTRYRAKITGISLETAPYTEDFSDLVGGGIMSVDAADQRHRVRETQDEFGHDGMTTRPELRAMCTKLFGSKFAGVFAPSESVKLSAETPYSIVNIKESPGEHWVGHVFDPEDPTTDMVYDPLGGDRSVKTDPDAEQSVTTDNCGQHVVAFLKLVDSQGVEAGATI